MKRSLAILGLLVVATISTPAQTCTLTISNYSETDTFSGSAVIPNSYLQRGAGFGEIGGSPAWGAEIATAPISGDVTFIAEITGKQGAGPAPVSGIFIQPSGAGRNEVSAFLLVQTINGVSEITMWRSWWGGSIWEGTIQVGSQAFTTYPFTLKLVRTGLTYTGYVALDNINYLTIGTFTVTTFSDPSTVGFVTYSGDHTNLTTASYSNVSLNGSYPTLADRHVGRSPADDASGSGSPIFQGGQLFIGQDTITGTVTLSSGCSGGGNHPFSLVPSNNLSLVVNPNTNPVTILSSGTVTNPTIPCDSSCSFSITNPYPGNTPWGPATLVHGSPYNFTSTTYLSIRNSVGQLVIDSPPIVTTRPLNP